MLQQISHALTIVWYVISGALSCALSCVFSCGGNKKQQPDLNTDVCLVTGAGQGLGRQLALQLAECGAKLVLWDINEEKVQAVAEEIRKSGHEAFGYVVDCSKREDVYRVAAQVKNEVGLVAVLVNNAGIAPEKAFVNGDLKDEEIERTFAVNTLALYWTVRAFLPDMLKNNYGYITNVASIAAFGGYPYSADYSASKAAVLNFSETLRSELYATKHDGIHVTCVCPLFINTRMVWESRALRKGHSESVMEPQFVAEKIVTAMAEKQFLLSVPKIVYLAAFAKSILPQKAYDAFLFTRVLSSTNPLVLNGAIKQE